jgi:NAD(P)-dependent dehydrogenase (short-subunit alcohol dehydrogenase family)
MLKGKVALVVGASSGIGRACALAFGAAGAKVLVSARREAESRAVVEEIEAAGGTAAFVKVDVVVESEVEALVAATVKRFGRLDCAVNAAAVSEDFALITEADADVCDRMLAINIKGTVLAMKHEIRQMVRQGGGGSVVNLSSILGHMAPALGTGNIYVATKHAILGLTRTAALGHIKEGIRVNCVSPTVVTGTPMVDFAIENHPEVIAPVIADIPMGRPCRVEEVARAVLWLCSDEASFVNGHSLLLDSGQTVK